MSATAGCTRAACDENGSTHWIAASAVAAGFCRVQWTPARKAAAAADHAGRQAAALAGRATEIPDMIEALYTVMPRLTEAQRDWVEKIDQTAAASRRDGFTTKQAAVIRDMYRKQFQKPRG